MTKTPGALNISEEQIAEVIARIGEGLTLKQSCKLAKFDYINIVKRIGASVELKQLHARAREEYVRTRVQDMHDIAKNSKIDPARARLMIDVIKWESARVLPKEYGDRVQQEVIITNNTTLSQRMQHARARAVASRTLLNTPPHTIGEENGE
jgi:hypothetical protein